MFLGLDEGLGIEAGQLAEGAQELGGRVQADGGLEIGLAEGFAEVAAVLAVHADVDVRIDQPADICQVAAERKGEIDLGADAFDQAADFGEIRRAVEHAVSRADDVDLGLGAFDLLRRFRIAALGLAIFCPEPEHGAVRRLPLVFVDRAREETLDVRAFRRDAAADHLGDGTGHDDGGKFRIEHGAGAFHRGFGAMLAEFFLAEAGDHDGELMRGQSVRVMKN